MSQNQALSDIVVNNIYRTCFKELGGRPDKEIGGSDKQVVASCFQRMIAAYKIVSPAIFKTFDFQALEAGEGEEGGEEGGEESDE